MGPRSDHLWRLVLALSLCLPAAVSAQESIREPAKAGEVGAAEQQGLGSLFLKISPGSRVTSRPAIVDAVFRVQFNHQTEPLHPQLVGAELQVIQSFAVVPVSRNAVRLDLRLDTGVRGVSLVRAAEDRLEIHFADHMFAGNAVRLETVTASAEETLRRYPWRDRRIRAILNAPGTQPADRVDWAPVIWPVGRKSPVRLEPPLEIEPHMFGRLPQAIRDEWRGDEALKRSSVLADQGQGAEGARILRGYPMLNDQVRARVALARAHAWAQPEVDGEPAHAGRAAEAYRLAAALTPRSDWVPWARGQAGYNYERERNFIESAIQYRRAIERGRDHEDRPYWHIGLGMTLIQGGSRSDGISEIVDNLDGLPKSDESSRFLATMALAYGLWKEGDSTRASFVVDTLLKRHPILARSARYDLMWSRIYLDGGRPAKALPFLERMELEDPDELNQIRARWWLHEAALSHRDADAARRWLRLIIEQTPESTLVPIARVRLEVLDAIVSQDSASPVSWQKVALNLRNRALAWPHTVVEDEAISATALLFIDMGLLEDGLVLYRWLRHRTPSMGGPVAYNHVVCHTAPRLFDELRSRGEVTRALGIYRAFLDDLQVRACLNPSTRREAAATALAAGLPGMAARWLSEAVAEGATEIESRDPLLSLAAIYLREGQLQAAAKTLDYLEASEAVLLDERFSALRGDVLSQFGEHESARREFDRSIVEAQASVRTRAAVPSLLFRRGMAAQRAGKPEIALADLQEGLRGGGAENMTSGWLMVAQIASQLARGAADWEAVLEACDAAEQFSGEERARRISWYRARALDELGRDGEAKTLLEGLAGEADAWGLMAREMRSSVEFKKAFEGLIDVESWD